MDYIIVQTKFPGDQPTPAVHHCKFFDKPKMREIYSSSHCNVCILNTSRGGSPEALARSTGQRSKESTSERASAITPEQPGSPPFRRHRESAVFDSPRHTTSLQVLELFNAFQLSHAFPHKPQKQRDQPGAHGSVT
jgi:hypothetical protein